MSGINIDIETGRGRRRNPLLNTHDTTHGVKWRMPDTLHPIFVEWRTKASNMRTISISLYMDIAEQSSHSFPDGNNNYYVIAKRGRAPPRHCHPPPDGIDFVLGIRYSLPAVGFLSTYRSLWRVFWHSLLCCLIQCWYWNYPSIAHIHLILVCAG